MSNHGWSKERRIKQAEAIKRWNPWEQSTGPVTDDGKARVARNAYKGAKRPKLRGLKSKLREIFKELKDLPAPMACS